MRPVAHDLLNQCAADAACAEQNQWCVVHRPRFKRVHDGKQTELHTALVVTS